MYFGTIKGERYPKEILNRLSKEKQKEFIEIDDKIMADLVKEANSTNSTIVVGSDGQPTLEKRVVSANDMIRNQITPLKSFLTSSNYIAINYGSMRTDIDRQAFLSTISDTYNKTNEEVLDERDSTISKINELKELLVT